jgi:hypothetical protein
MAEPQTPALKSLSAGLRGLLRSRKARLGVGEIVERFEAQGGLGAVLFVLTLPVLIPLPPGASMILALPLLVVAPQIVMRRRRLWLPRWLARRTLERKVFDKSVRRVLPLLERLEAVGRPRLAILTGPAGVRLIGVACTILALVLVLPIPFANLFPALALGLFALGLTRRDGLMVLGGYALLALATVVINLGARGVMALLHRAVGLA